MQINNKMLTVLNDLAKSQGKDLADLAVPMKCLRCGYYKGAYGIFGLTECHECGNLMVPQDKVALQCPVCLIDGFGFADHDKCRLCNTKMIRKLEPLGILKPHYKGGK